MAIEFARVRYIKRSDGGNVCRTAAYNARRDVFCKRTGERFFFGHRPDLVHHEVMLPDGAEPRFLDPVALWNASQAMDLRKDAQEARELLLALPNDPEFTLGDWQRMTRAFVSEQFVKHGLAVQIDIHGPHDNDGDGQDKNVHAHLIISQRRLDANGFSATKARDLEPDVRTFNNGQRAVTEAEKWGVLWRDFQDRWFETHGFAVRVDPTGFIPQEHEGPVRLRSNPKAAADEARDNVAANAEAARDPERILAAVTRNRATFSPLDIERLLRKHIASPEERQRLLTRALAHESVVALYDRDSGKFVERYTLRSVRDEEAVVLATSRKIRDQQRSVAIDAVRAVLDEHMLEREQRVAFLSATGTDGLVLIEGAAGSGKTASIRAIREVHERAGWRTIGLAPTNTVADDLRRAGFAHASTLHLELFYQENGRIDRTELWNRRTVVIVDEAAMVDTKTYARLMHWAAETRAKLVLVGDDRQLASVERGGMFSELRREHGAQRITKVRRQHDTWQRSATEAFAEGRVAEGLRAYAEHGRVHWSGKLDESRTRLLSDWDQGSRERPDITRFVYASTNAEAQELNAAIQRIRRTRGDVGEGLQFVTDKGLVRIAPGDRIQFYGNDRAIGIYNGGIGTVRSVSREAIAAAMHNGKQVTFDPRAFDKFGLGYASTIYRGQGKTQTEVLAFYDNAFAWNARTAYVGLSRHRSTVDLYVSRDLASDEASLVRQMSRTMRDEASLVYAERAEVVSLSQFSSAQKTDSRVRPAHPRASVDDAAPGPTGVRVGGAAPEATGPRPPIEDARLDADILWLNLPAYAVTRHGYEVTWEDTARTRASLRRGDERLRAKLGPDSAWTYFSDDDPYDRGDIVAFEAWRSQVSHEKATATLRSYDGQASLHSTRKAEDKSQPTLKPPRPR